MGMTKNYLLKILENCSQHQFGQDAVEWAIVSGHVALTGDLETDLRAILGEPGKPETGRYDEFCEAWRRVCNDNEVTLMLSTADPILEEMLRSVSLAQSI
jgi:hypothetical protein